MDLPSLESLAEVSVTLAGFAAVFRAFATGTDPDGYSAVRLNVVIEGGLVLAFLCFLPTVLHAASIPEDGALRVSSGLGATWVFFRVTIPGIRIIRAGWPPPAVFPLGFSFSLAALISFGAGSLGVAPSSAAHQVAAVALFGLIACTFVAQFRVERRE